MTMEILNVNYEIGAKCYTRYQGAFRECIFMGTRGIRKKVNCTISYYILNIAGIGIVNLEFDRMNQFNNWYYGSDCYTPLYATLEDCINKTNPITAQYGATDNCYNKGFMKQFFPECSVCNCGGGIYGWAWNGTDAVEVVCGLTNTEYTIDKNGFHREGKVYARGYVHSYSFCKDLGKIYPSKISCMAENQPTIVTF